MLVTKSDRISILPITNKNKLISLSKYFDKILITKNLISKQLNKDKAFQNLLFSNKKEDSKLLLAYCNKLNYPILSAWELQKFVNADFIDKEKKYKKELTNCVSSIAKFSNWINLLESSLETKLTIDDTRCLPCFR